VVLRDNVVQRVALTIPLPVFLSLLVASPIALPRLTLTPLSPFGSEGSYNLTFTRGPEYFTRFRPPNPEGSHSTRSDSKRSSINQVSVFSRPLSQQVLATPRSSSTSAEQVSRLTHRTRLWLPGHGSYV
jgi:hypothetical protein